MAATTKGRPYEEGTIRTSNQYCDWCHKEVPLCKKETTKDGDKHYHKYCYDEMRMIRKKGP